MVQPVSARLAVRPERADQVGRYVAATGHASPDLSARIRAAGDLDQLDETLSPQLLADAIAATPPDDALGPSRSDALALLGEMPRDSFQLPQHGLPFVCEVCGDRATVQGRRRQWTARVPWAQLDPGASDAFEEILLPLLELPSA